MEERKALREFRHPKYLAEISRLEAEYKEKLEYEETVERVNIINF